MDLIFIPESKTLIKLREQVMHKIENSSTFTNKGSIVIVGGKLVVGNGSSIDNYGLIANFNSSGWNKIHVTNSSIGTSNIENNPDNVGTDEGTILELINNSEIMRIEKDTTIELGGENISMKDGQLIEINKPTAGTVSANINFTLKCSDTSETSEIKLTGNAAIFDYNVYNATTDSAKGFKLDKCLLNVSEQTNLVISYKGISRENG